MTPTIITLTIIIMTLIAFIVFLINELVKTEDLVRDLNRSLIGKDSCANRFIRRAQKLEAEVDRLNENQNGYRHPVTGVYCAKDEYYEALLGGKS